MNGYKVINIMTNKINGNKLIAIGIDCKFETVKEIIEADGIELLSDKDIKTIVTKEQMSSIEYRVEG